jgi:hypothetical protein
MDRLYPAMAELGKAALIGTVTPAFEAAAALARALGGEVKPSVDSHFKRHFPSPEENADNRSCTKPLARQLGGRAAWQAFERGGLPS